MYLLLSLIIIILIHEGGHFFAAKLCKCGVIKFSLGFGKPIFQFTYKKTIYQIAPILLGGFIQLKDELNYSRSKYAFTNKTYAQKVFISLAGIIVNVITGLIAWYSAPYFHSEFLSYFGYYSIIIAISNLIPAPPLDGFYPIIFLFEKKWGKKKTYEIFSKICRKWFKWMMILNILSLPILTWMIYTKQIL